MEHDPQTISVKVKGCISLSVFGPQALAPLQRWTSNEPGPLRIEIGKTLPLTRPADTLSGSSTFSVDELAAERTAPREFPLPFKRGEGQGEGLAWNTTSAHEWVETSYPPPPPPP